MMKKNKKIFLKKSIVNSYDTATSNPLSKSYDCFNDYAYEMERGGGIKIENPVVYLQKDNRFVTLNTKKGTKVTFNGKSCVERAISKYNLAQYIKLMK